MASEIGTNVKIKLVSTIIPTDGEKETVEMWLEGSITQRAGIDYLRYNEVHEGATIHTTIKLVNEQALIMRSGAVKMRLPLNTEQLERGHYENAQGSIPLETNTKCLEHKTVGGSGSFTTQYELIIGGMAVGNYTLEINYSEGQI